MQKRKLAAYIILAIAALCLIALAGSRLSSLITVFSAIDSSIACVLLLAALVIGIVRSQNGMIQLSTSVLAASAISLGVAIFATIFGLSHSETAMLAGAWFGCFAVARLTQSTEIWTRPAAIATVVMLMFWLTVDNSFLSSMKETTSQFAAWIASSLLDSVAVPHLYEIQSIKLLNGDLQLSELSAAWFGVLPVIGVIALICLWERCSFFQSILVGLIAFCTWSCMEGVYVWWTGWAGAAGSDPVSIHVGVLGHLWNVLMLVFVVLNAFLFIALTDPIPLEREDLDYPVSTYFWNFFTRFPASLTSEPIPRHQ